jgi:hypothetical protein
MPDLHDVLADAVAAQPPAQPPPLESLMRRARRRRNAAVALVAVAVAGVAILIPALVTTANGSNPSAPSRLRTGTSASPTPTPSDRASRRSVAQAVLGPKFSLIGSRHGQLPGPTSASGSPTFKEWKAATIEEWKAANGDEANITWQPDNKTLERNAPPTQHTASGDRYEIQHAPNGSVEIVIYGNGNAVLYTRIDPNVNPNDRHDGVLVSDVPGDRTLIRQAARLLAAS